MSQSIIHESVEVYAVFKQGQVIPRAFRWAGRTYQIETINQKWAGRNGSIRLYYFAVTAAGNAYKLCFNSQELDWVLEEVYV